MRRIRISVRYQVLGLITVVLVGAMGAYLTLTARLVMRDKLAYVYEINAALAHAKGEEVHGNLSSLAARLAYFAAAGGCPRTLLETDPDLIAAEVWRRSGAGFKRSCRVVDEDRLAAEDLSRADLAHVPPAGELAAEISAGGGIAIRNASLPPDRVLLMVAADAPGGGIVVAHLHPERLLRLFSGSTSWSAYLVDARGNVLVHPDPATMSARANLSALPIVRDALHDAVPRGVSEFRDESDERWLGAFSRVETGRLAVVTMAPRSVALQAVAELAWRSVLFAFAVVLLAFLLAIFFSRRLTRPLSLLEEAAAALARGELGHEVRVHSSNEIGSLARAFNQMSKQVLEREQRIKQTQAQLIQADRMALVGTLASGVAHEINNPLTWISANLKFGATQVSQMARDAKPRLAKRLDEVAAALQEAVTGAERVKLIVSDLRVFARRTDDEKDPVDVQAAIESSLKMIAAETRRRTRVITHYEAVPPILANEARVGQVVLNLVVNAMQALPERPPDENEIHVTLVREGDSVLIEIRDNGTGIASEHLDRIFDPFFTTKPAGIGTGLGLAVCHSLVTAMSGTISVSSRPGSTSFRVAFPAAPDAVLPAAVPASAASRSLTGRLLVVDGEPAIVSAVRRMLPNAVVSEAHDALEALDALTNADEEFDFVLCALGLSGTSGAELFHRVRMELPRYQDRFVFTSDASPAPDLIAFLDTVPNERLEKPFDADALAAAMERTRERDLEAKAV